MQLSARTLLLSLLRSGGRLRFCGLSVLDGSLIGTACQNRRAGRSGERGGGGWRGASGVSATWGADTRQRESGRGAEGGARENRGNWVMALERAERGQLACVPARIDATMRTVAVIGCPAILPGFIFTLRIVVDVCSCRRGSGGVQTCMCKPPVATWAARVEQGGVGGGPRISPPPCVGWLWRKTATKF